MPTTSNPAPISVQCIEDVPDPDVNIITNANDNCSNASVIFVSDVSDGQSCQQTITRTYRVSDECGNSIDINQSIFINDTIPPNASNPAPISVQCIEDVPEPDVNAVNDESDNCSNPVVTFVSDVSNNVDCYETITRTYRITDECGNFTEVSQSIIINDTTPPTASNPSPITIQCIDDIPQPDISVVTDAIDNCSTPIVSFAQDISDNMSCNETITRTYRVIDECGNETLVNQSIFIIDDSAPELISELNSDIYISCEQIPEVPELQFVDNCDENINVEFEESESFTDDLNYQINRIWTVTDDCLNQSTFSQIIYVNRITEINSQFIELCIGDDPLDVYALVPYLRDSNSYTQINEWSGDDIDYLDNGMFNPGEGLGEYTFINNIQNNDCIWTTSITILVHDECFVHPCIENTRDVNISKMITPNNDGFNDYFEVSYIINQESNKNCDIKTKVQLFNRWGTKIYESDNYDNNWSGIANKITESSSSYLPTGTYYYIIELENSGLKPIQGFIYLGTE